MTPIGWFASAIEHVDDHRSHIPIGGMTGTVVGGAVHIPGVEA